jgi:Skp family chaperone for outer membrane proteins
MTRHRITIVLVGAALSIGLAESGLLSHRRADGATERKTGRKMVVSLDVNQVFKENRRFKAAMAKMQAEVAKAEADVKREREKLKTQVDESQKLPPGSDERSKRDEQVNKIEAAINAHIAFQKKMFVQQEAAIYYKAYHELLREVEAYARANGIEVVIRAINSPADVTKPEEVLREVNQSLIWAAPGTDITAAIIERLNARKDDSVENSQ